jgi:hypothetical protein
MGVRIAFGFTAKAIQHRVERRRLVIEWRGVYRVGRRPLTRNPIHVSVPANRRIRLKGIQPHRRNPMPPATAKCSIPLSQPLFTLVDLAATLDRDPLEAAINDADRINLIDPEALEAGLDGIPLFPGVAMLRHTLARYTRTDSNLERRLLAPPTQAPSAAADDPRAPRPRPHRLPLAGPEARR